MKIKHLIVSAVTAVTIVVTAFVLNAAGAFRSVADDIWKYEIEQAGASDYDILNRQENLKRPIMRESDLLKHVLDMTGILL